MGRASVSEKPNFNFIWKTLTSGELFVKLSRLKIVILIVVFLSYYTKLSVLYYVIKVMG